MIMPIALRELGATCDDSKWLGDVFRALCGQDVKLDFGQKQTLASLQRENEKHTRYIETRRESDRKRKADARARYANAGGNAPQVSAQIPASPQAAATVPRQSGGKPRETGADSVAVDLSQVDVSDDSFFSGKSDAVLMARKITGDMGKAAGVYWRKWIKADEENGEPEFLQILFQFNREIKAGEDVANRGAAFTQRLKDWRKGKAKQKQ